MSGGRPGRAFGGSALSAWIAERPTGAAVWLGLLHAALFTLAFPPLSFSLAAPLSVAPLAALSAGTTRPRRAGLIAGALSIIAWSFHHRWLIDVTIPGMIVLLVYLALYPLAFVWIGGAALKRFDVSGKILAAAIGLPLLWAALETIRSLLIFDGYPWYLIATPTIDWGSWRFLASWVGLIGLGLPTAALGAWLGLATLRSALLERTALGGGVAIVIALGALLGAVARPDHAGETVVPIGVVQTNVPQSNKIGWTFERQLEDFARFIELTEQAANPDEGGPPALIVWPETMFPGIALNADALAVERAAQLGQTTPLGFIPTTYFVDRLLERQAALGTPMIVGAIAREGLRFVETPEGGLRVEQEAKFNSAFLIVDGVIEEARYDKIHLTPFGEYMPYISASDWLESRLLAIGAPGMTFDLSRGVSADPLVIPTDSGPLRAAPPICFEATMPGVCRRLVVDEQGQRRADALVHLTNDGWFTRWAGGRIHHLLLARWRAIELATPVVRAANTGVSGGVDAHGNLIARGPDARESHAWVDGVMRVDLPVVRDRPVTPYAHLGDWLAWASVAGASVWLGAAALVGRGRRDERAPDEGGSKQETTE